LYAFGTPPVDKLCNYPLSIEIWLILLDLVIKTPIFCEITSNNAHFMKITAIINNSAGYGKILGENNDLESIMKNYYPDSDVIKTSGDKISAEVKKALNKGSEIIAVSGGDGSISSAAGVLINSDVPLAVIPSGTLNHFAKDTGTPLDIEEAVKNINEGKIIKVDMGEVNGKYFINNSSVGLYPKIVKHRDREIKKEGSGKWTAMGRAIINVFKKMPMIDVRIKSDFTKIICSTPFVFIGNNEYYTDLFNAGARENLTGGKLSLFYPTWTGRFTLLRFAFLALIDKLKDQKDFHMIDTEEIKIETKYKELEVAVDGEVFHMKTPLYYKIHPRALNIIIPEEQE
jgi:diacylglycerol kinase family enzyme